MRVLRFASLVVAGAFFAVTAQARPVSYADGWMLMNSNDHTGNSLGLMYSPTAKYSLGVRSDFMDADNAWLHTANYNRLLKRWNGDDSQANIFLLTGAGMMTDEHDSNAAATVGIEADWETRRYYTYYENRVIEAGDMGRQFSQKARLGIAPYVGEYDDVHTWLMLQGEHHPAEKHNTTITPMVRVFNQSVLAEFGISNHKDVMFNITLQY